MDKSRANCEKIRLADTNKKCVYIKEDHRCEEGNVYNNCNDYKGSDKKICENIVSPKRNSNCVLAEDLTCKEIEFHCKEAYDRYDCSYMLNQLITTKNVFGVEARVMKKLKDVKIMSIKILVVKLTVIH